MEPGHDALPWSTQPHMPYSRPRRVSPIETGAAACPARIMCARAEFRVPNIMKRVMRCHDFCPGREARRRQYRQYCQGGRQSHGQKLVPARRVAATIGGAPQRGAGAPLAGMRPRRRARVPRVMARPCPASRSHPTLKRLEPAPPSAGHFVGRLGHIRDMSCAPLRVIPNSGSQRTRVSLC